VVDSKDVRLVQSISIPSLHCIVSLLSRGKLQEEVATMNAYVWVWVSRYGCGGWFGVWCGCGSGCGCGGVRVWGCWCVVGCVGMCRGVCVCASVCMHVDWYK